MNSTRRAEVAELVVESLMPGRVDIVRQLFNSEGLRAPDIIWSPIDTEIAGPLHRKFANVCRSLSAKDDRIIAGTFDVADFNGLAEWMMVLDVEDGGKDFRYSHYGRAVAEAACVDMQDRRVSEFDGYIAVFYTALYRAVLKTKEWVYSRHESPRRHFARGWQRLIVPVFGKTGEIEQMIVLNVADNEMSVGLELLSDPVFVVSEDKDVVFLNRAARNMFNIPSALPASARLEHLTGIALSVDVSPETLLSENQVVDTIELTPNGSMMERLSMTVSAAEHRGRAFYIVVIRLLGT